MKQLEVVSLLVGGGADFVWIPFEKGVEVMAWPARVGRVFIAVSARTASACAAALTRSDWIVSLTTPKIEDLIYERAAVSPAPVLLDPQSINVSSVAAIIEHSIALLARLGAAPLNALVACGQNWVLTNGSLGHPGRAANYGLFSSRGPYPSVTGRHRMWQPLSFTHDFDYFDYSQLLRLVRRRPGVPLPAYDNPLRVFDLVHSLTPAPGAEP